MKKRSVVHIATLVTALGLLVFGAVVVARPEAVKNSSTDDLISTRPAVTGVHGVVATGHPIVSSVGLQVLVDGGNAFDAAVAVGAVGGLAVPELDGIGGNGFMTVFDATSGEVRSLSMTGAAPGAIRPLEMTPETLFAGMQAGIVPGNLGGYLSLLDRFGTMSLAEVLAPGIEIAEHGYPIDPVLAHSIDLVRDRLARYPTTARIYLPGGKPLGAGDLLKNPDYARTLRKLVAAERRAKSKGASRSAAIQAAFTRFYAGDIAREIDRFFRAQGGVLTAADLAAYEPRWTEPIHTTYRGFDVYTSPSTSRGGFELLMQANLAEELDIGSLGSGSTRLLHAEIEAVKLVKADTYRYVVDPAFADVPTSGLLSRSYAASRRGLIDGEKPADYGAAGKPVGAATETAAPSARPAGSLKDDYAPSSNTTSFSIVDRFGNAVAATTSLGDLFGSNVVVGTTGLLLNNGMHLGATSPYQQDPNHVRPGQIPILNNAPVVVLKNGRPAFVFGSAGGEGIGPIEFQMLTNLIDFGMPIQEAIEAPRFALGAEPNFSKPGADIVVYVESRFPPDTIAALRRLGHTVEVLEGWGSLGHLQAIKIDVETGVMTAGGDPRRTGTAAGY